MWVRSSSVHSAASGRTWEAIMTEKYELSRRKLLAGLGTIGVAGAGAGMGTSALYTDQESFEDNVIRAGALNLVLEAGVIATNREGGLDNEDVAVTGAASVNSENEVTVALDLEDVKPGDCYVLHTDEIVQHNPAYLEMSFTETADDENGYEEPEPETSGAGDADSPGDASGGGELDDMMTLTSWYGGYSGNDNLVDPAEVTCDNVDEVSLAQLIEEQTLQSAFDGLAEFGTADDPSTHEAVAPHQTDVSQEYVPGEPGTGPAPFDPNDLDPGRYRKFWVFHLDESVGNEVQGDSVAFDINARVEQVRNNDDPF